MFYAESIFVTKQLISHPKHLEAKKRYSDWLSGYQVVISQVLRTYGGKTIQHPLLAANTSTATKV